ncbi:MAG: hypothetical protein WA789_10170 [Candidatus Acidiferrum sp.]
MGARSAVGVDIKFLVALEGDLGTKGTAEKAKFKVKTLEPLEAGEGIYLPSGAVIEGHVSHVEPAGVAGRARLWLTFDEIQTSFGRIPIVAEVMSVPEDHSVKNKPGQEGLIEGRSSAQENAAQVAAGTVLGEGVEQTVCRQAASENWVVQKLGRSLRQNCTLKLSEAGMSRRSAKAAPALAFRRKRSVAICDGGRGTR